MQRILHLFLTKLFGKICKQRLHIPKENNRNRLSVFRKNTHPKNIPVLSYHPHAADGQIPVCKQWRWIVFSKRLQKCKLMDQFRTRISHRHGHVNVNIRTDFLHRKRTVFIDFSAEFSTFSSGRDNPAAIGCPPNFVNSSAHPHIFHTWNNFPSIFRCL